jgi:hypothetical protein
MHINYIYVRKLNRTQNHQNLCAIIHVTLILGSALLLAITTICITSKSHTSFRITASTRFGILRQWQSTQYGTTKVGWVKAT